MTSQQENYLQMCGGLVKSSDNYQSIVSTLPMFNPKKDEISSIMKEIMLCTVEQKNNRTGITAVKNSMKNKLIQLTIETNCKLTPYAIFTNDIQLIRDCSLSASRIKELSEVSLRDYAQLIYNKAQTHLTKLSDYHINETTQQELLTTINAYWDSLSEAKLKHNQQVRITQQIKSLFKNIHEALVIMDKSVEIVRHTHPEFYAHYKKARHITDYGKGSLAITGVVTDAITGEPLKGVQITFSESSNNSRNKGNNVLVKRSAEKGQFRIKNISSGEYAFTAGKNGYNEQVGTLVVSEGQKQKLNIQLSMN